LYVDGGGSEEEAAQLKIRWNRLKARLEWFQKRGKKWEVVTLGPDPASGCVPNVGKDDEGGEERRHRAGEESRYIVAERSSYPGSKAKIAEGQGSREGEEEDKQGLFQAKAGKEVEEIDLEEEEQGGGAGPGEPERTEEDLQLRAIFASHSDSEDGAHSLRREKVLSVVTFNSKR
jgi:hypothetical protein